MSVQRMPLPKSLAEAIVLKHLESRSLRLSDETNSTDTLTAFHQFPKFPIELRYKIWNFALPGPRTVEMRLSCNYKGYQHDFVTSKFPIILHVCKESRKEAKKSYTLSFHSPKYSIPVYFNFQKDTLLIRTRDFDGARIRKVIDMLPQKDLVQRLAVPLDLWPGARYLGPGEYSGQRSVPSILSFPSLKEVVSYQNINWYGGTHQNSCEERRSCMLDRNDVVHLGKTGEIEKRVLDQVFVSAADSTANFLKDFRGGKWPNIQWQEPEWIYKALCQKGVESSFACPYLKLAQKERTARNTRVAKYTQSLVARA